MLERDGRTDGRTDRIPLANTALCIASNVEWTRCSIRRGSVNQVFRCI